MEMRISEHVLYTDDYGNKLIKKFLPSNSWELWCKDINGKYWQGEKLQALIKRAEAAGINVRQKPMAVDMSRFNPQNVLRKFGY